jgi:tetratricopeptide (TPR) repeat protein
MTAYYQQGRLDETISEAKSLLDILPESFGALTTLSSAHIRLRDFSEAMRYVEKLREYHSDDPYRMITYYQYKANLAFWSGKFKTGIGFMTDALNKALETGDSAYVSVRHQALADYSWTLGMPDSVLAYGKRGYDWAVGFHNLQYPLLLVTVDPGKEPEARVLLEEATENFRSSVPSELWEIANAIEDIFDARCESDTVKLVQAYEGLIANQTERSSANLSEFGMLQVLVGQYESGKEVLESLVKGGDEETSQAVITLLSLYYIGVANEALGNKEEAIANYREVLKYWGEPEIELKEIADIRERLKGLVS